MLFTSYIIPLISSSFHWITYLTLSSITCSRTDILQLSQLTNLGALTIGKDVKCPDIGLDDSIIRSWGRAATESNVFSMLRVLNCRLQKDITPRALNYLNDFPSLAIFTVEDSNIGPRDKRAALSLGWKYKTGNDLSGFLANEGATNSTWDSILRACFNGGGAYSVRRITAEGVEVINSLPTLHFLLGGAMPDAAVNVTGNQSMRLFHRIKAYIPAANNEVEGMKRPLERSSQQSSLARKKPTIRSSKHQSLESILMGFGS